MIDTINLCVKYASSCKLCPRNRKCEEELKKVCDKVSEKQALEILIISLQNQKPCGRLSQKEKDSIKILRTYFKNKNS